MRTTLTIDDDVLGVARDLASRDQLTVGQVISDLARRALTSSEPNRTEAPAAFHGFRPLPRRGVVVSNEAVNAIREDEAV